jgi:hypothetical protein
MDIVAISSDAWPAGTRHRSTLRTARLAVNGMNLMKNAKVLRKAAEL